MSYYQNLTPYQLRFIDKQIHSVAWNQTKFLNFFQKSPGARMTYNPTNGTRKVDGGLVRSVEEGLEEIHLTSFAKMKPGQISGGLQKIPTQYVKMYDQTEPLMYLVTKVAIPVNFTHAWQNNNQIETMNIMNKALDETMKPLTNQVDQFLAYGSDMLTPLGFDPMKQSSKFTGLFNGFQSFSGGASEDDVMTAAGAFIETYLNGKFYLNQQGFDTGPYFILTDYKTAKAAQTGNNLYTTYAPVTEKKHMENEYRDELYGWIDSVNAYPNSDTDQYRMCITQPFISVQGDKIEPAYALYVGYNFRVFPLWAGGLNGKNMSYEFVVAWSGRLQPIGPSGNYALYRTGGTLGTLTLS